MPISSPQGWEAHSKWRPQGGKLTFENLEFSNFPYPNTSKNGKVRGNLLRIMQEHLKNKNIFSLKLARKYGIFSLGRKNRTFLLKEKSVLIHVTFPRGWKGFLRDTGLSVFNLIFLKGENSKLKSVNCKWFACRDTWALKSLSDIRDFKLIFSWK